MKLTERLPCHAMLNGHRYRLHLSYDRVLLALDAYGNAALTDYGKADTLCGLLVRRPPWRTVERVELAQKIVTDFIFPDQRDNAGGDEPPAFDFSQDAPYIYAAFWQVYRIDLLKERGRMDWRRFYALFLGLPGNTRLSEIISIRLRDVPTPTEYNQDEIRALRKAKRAFALDIKRKPGERFDSDIEGRVTGMFEYYRKKAGEKYG